MPKTGGSGSDSDMGGADSWSEDDDPSFDEKNRKPIKAKIKREASERSTRQRKRPSFFQEYENEEDNLDKILDEFEQEQIQEARKPREAKPKKEKAPAGGGRTRKRKAATPPPVFDEDKEIEFETSRSGRVRKIRRRKVFAFDGGEDEDEDSGDEEKDEYKPESEPEEEEDDFEAAAEAAAASGGNEEQGEEEDDEKLPLKKRKKSGAAMTKAEIEEAKKAAFAAKPHIEVDRSKLRRKKDYRDDIDSIIKPGEEDNLDFSDDELSQVLKVSNQFSFFSRVFFIRDIHGLNEISY